jgi:multicomponent Na+:H+ antiporter subunit E
MNTPDWSLNSRGSAQMSKARTGILVGFAARTAILSGLWWIIVQGRPDSWLVGLPAVALAALASVRLDSQAPPRLSLAGLIAFLALFLRESIRGGLDVARRTLEPRLRIEPGFMRYRLHVSDPTARVLLINCIGLLPGTLAADLDGDHAELHLLDTGENSEPQLLRLEQAVARLFGLTLEAGDV